MSEFVIRPYDEWTIGDNSEGLRRIAAKVASVARFLGGLAHGQTETVGAGTVFAEASGFEPEVRPVKVGPELKDYDVKQTDHGPVYRDSQETANPNPHPEAAGAPAPPEHKGANEGGSS